MRATAIRVKLDSQPSGKKSGGHAKSFPFLSSANHVHKKTISKRRKGTRRWWALLDEPGKSSTGQRIAGAIRAQNDSLQTTIFEWRCLCFTGKPNSEGSSALFSTTSSSGSPTNTSSSTHTTGQWKVVVVIVSTDGIEVCLEPKNGQQLRGNDRGR